MTQIMVAEIPASEMAQIENTTSSKTVRRMLGLDLDSWNAIMLLSLAVAAFAAVFVVVSTAVVIKLQKKDALEASERIESLRHANLVLEAQLAPRSLTEAQFNTLQKLRGKIAAVNIGAEVDLEPSWFAMQVVNAFQKAGIEVRIFWRGPMAHSSTNMLFDSHAFHNPNGEPTGGEPLVSILREAGMFDGGILAVMPLDLNGPLDIPMFIIGGRFHLPPKPPFFGANKNEMPPPTMIDRMKAP
jgi:hypothetical protein